MSYYLTNVSKAILLRDVFKSLYVVLPNVIHLCTSRNSSVDALDHFTSLLVKQKGSKWIRHARQTNNTVDPMKAYVNDSIQYTIDDKLSTCIDISNLSVDHVDNLLSNALDLENISDIEYIIDQCLKYERIPSIDVFLETISVFSRRGLKDDVRRLQVLLQKNSPVDYNNNGDLRHFWAEALWVQGNIEEAIKIFKDIYKKYPNLKNKIRKMINNMVSETICKGSQATLVMMTNFGKIFASEFNEYFVLCSIWEICFSSEWYSDQLWASDIVKECVDLQAELDHRFLPLAMNCLHKHEVNTVHRLLELLLSINKKHQYIRILHVLFDYKCWRRDLRGCTEIMNVAIAQGIPMRSAHQVKFVQLLLGNEHPRLDPPTKIPVPRYRLKF